MKKHQLCCIGHITLDKVVTPQSTVYMPGGTAFYCSHAIRHFNDIDYTLVTAVGATEMNVVKQLRKVGIDVTALPSRHSVYFENIYGTNPDDRTQRVLAKADPFTASQLREIDAEIYHLGSLLADDFSLEVIKELSLKGLIAVDSQGYLREVRDTHVYPTDWTDKREALRYIHFLKVNEHEMEVLTGLSDPHEAARRLHEWGVKEVLVTLGSMGSLIFNGTDFFRIPAYKPAQVVDATGCGDTYSERQINKLLFHPFVWLGIFPLKAHIDCHRLIAHGHSKRHHHTVILYVPHGFYTTLDHIRIVKRKEQMQIILSGHGFFFDKVIFRQINCFIVHKCWCGRQSCHKTKQTILYCKLSNSFLYLLWSFALRFHSSDIDSV